MPRKASGAGHLHGSTVGQVGMLLRVCWRSIRCRGARRLGMLHASRQWLHMAGGAVVLYEGGNTFGW
jgi:hypothetical protein